jgi:murein DD-endopeptidase MepM/ murein hydrolase activator NlpD
MALFARALVALGAAVVAAGMTAPPVAAAQGDVASAEAAVRDAQRKASAAAKGLQGAEAELDDAEDEVVKGHAELAAARVRLNEASTVVRHAAVHEYTTGRANARLRTDDIVQITRGRAYLGVANGATTQQVDELRARASDLSDREKELERRVKAQRSKLAAFQKLEGQLAASLDRLGNELDAARRREAEAKAAAAAAQEAAERARLEGLARAAEEDRKRLEAARDGEARAARANAGPSGGAPVGAPVNKGPWLCPVQGGATFTNDYGFGRSGGRRHQGNDLFAPRGTPVVASVAGSYRRTSNGLGGISYYLQGADGNTYYGAHLSGYGPVGPGQVGQGAVLGFVGNTGNARGTSPHLHFEIHPGGGGPVNPFPTVSRAC